MRRVVCTLLACIALSTQSPARAEEHNELARARVAVRQLGYPDARTLLDAALKQGGHSRAELLEIYALRGEVEAVLNGADAAEPEFRKLLLLDPHHAGPTRDSPTFQLPFENARRWANNAGGLHIETKTQAVTAGSCDLVEQIVADPLAMATGVAVRYRLDDTLPYSRLSTTTWQQSLPIGVSGTRYYIEILDRWGNVLTSFGSATEPLSIASSSAKAKVEVGEATPPDTTPRWYDSTAGWALVGTGIVAAAVGGGLFGASSHAVDSAKSATNRSDYLNDARHATAFDASGGTILAIGGVLAVTGVAILIHRAIAR